MNYYMVYPDQTEVRWTLSMKRFYESGNRIDGWAFMKGKYYDSEQPIPFFVSWEGERMDYNPTALGAIVVSGSLATLIEEIASNDIQMLDATIDGESGVWKVMNFLSIVDCIDHTRSKIRYRSMDEPDRPGKPDRIDRLVIDESRAQGHHFFLILDWETEFVSETMRNAIEKAGITGITYGHRPVNSP